MSRLNIPPIEFLKEIESYLSFVPYPDKENMKKLKSELVEYIECYERKGEDDRTQ
jgi:hypothetical protein